MTYHIFTMTEIILINTGTWKHFLRYMYQKILPAMFMNITTHLLKKADISANMRLLRIENRRFISKTYCDFPPV